MSIGDRDAPLDRYVAAGKARLSPWLLVPLAPYALMVFLARPGR